MNGVFYCGICCFFNLPKGQNRDQAAKGDKKKRLSSRQPIFIV